MAADLSEKMQGADWKTEKHVPVIEAPESVAARELFDVKVTIGKEVAHPNETKHHIRWISLYFHAEGEEFPVQVGHFEFSAHGESAAGPDEGAVHTHHQVVATLKTTKPGTLHAMSYCNIHGLWQSTRELSVS